MSSGAKPMIDVAYLEQQRSGKAAEHLLHLLGLQAKQFVPKTRKTELTSTIQVKRCAQIAIRSLSVSDQKTVNSAIHRLRISPSSVMNRIEPVIKAGEAESVYFVPIGTLGILVRRVKSGPLDFEQISVEDIFDQSRLWHVLGKGQARA
jgi:hypothetical protein